MRGVYRILLAAGALVLTLALQLSVLPLLDPPHAVPDLVLLAVLALATAWGPNLGAVTGFCLGLAVDLAPPSVTAVGRHALVLTLVGALAGRAAAEARRSALRTSLWAGLYAAAATVGNALLGTLLGSGGTLGAPGLWSGALACGLYTAIATPLLFPWLAALGRSADGRRTQILAPVGDALSQTTTSTSTRTVTEL